MNLHELGTTGLQHFVESAASAEDFYNRREDAATVIQERNGHRYGSTCAEKFRRLCRDSGPLRREAARLAGEWERHKETVNLRLAELRKAWVERTEAPFAPLTPRAKFELQCAVEIFHSSH